MIKLYGDYPARSVGKQLLLARRLVEAGARLVAVMYGGWDHHVRIKEAVSDGMPAFDHAFSGLIADLDQRGLLDSTLVMVTSEFGRTPKINENGGGAPWARGRFRVPGGGAGSPRASYPEPHGGGAGPGGGAGGGGGVP